MSSASVAAEIYRNQLEREQLEEYGNAVGWSGVEWGGG